jgi:cytochrome c6
LKHSFRNIASHRNTPQLLTGLLSVVAVVLAGTAGIATAQKPLASARARHGETIFKAQCIGCHSKEAGDTTPFGPPNLHGVLAKQLLTPQQAAETIKQGKGAMPSFEGKLNDSDIGAVVAYLKTL